MIVNQASLSAITTSFKVLYQGAFDAAPSDWDKIATEVPSTTRQQTYAWLGTTTRFREWIGDRVIQNLGTHQYSIVNKPFENTVEVNRDDIEDDQLGVYRPLVTQMAQDAKTHPDELVFRLLAAGFTTPCYDGQYFFDTDHPVLDGAGGTVSVSNLQDGTGTPWYLLDTSKAIRAVIFQKRRDYTFVAMDKVDDEAVFARKAYRYGVDARVNAGFGLWQVAQASKAALTTETYAAARAAMMSIKGDQGKPLNIRPSLLVVPPSLEKAGLEVLKAERDAAGATNVYQNTAQLLVTPWLA
ncbi:Mu-like prophage major head subunit gpT family protein [Pararhodospirillum oryzae]|uniref:Head protein n=1 Tax=Pararhodospirillum oryzae TaxID=478448 RepID=A0A512H9Z7_9PROT|nr:Mu-like prophage major head subunit gpT family protein [Pararhodospirillum oryzae]GEO82276.1 head protein [Pararhodospirillum oryzae]